MIIEQGLLDKEFHSMASAKEAVDQARASGGVAWVMVRDPGDGEVESILHILGLDRRILLVADRHRGHAGIIALQGHLLVTLIALDEAADDLASIQALAGPDHVVTLLRGGAHGTTDLRRRVQERLDELAPGSPLSGMTTLVALLLAFFDRYDRILDRLDDTVQALAERVFPRPRRHHPCRHLPHQPTGSAHRAGRPAPGPRAVGGGRR
jgi:Mg2+ and Co2+ transporter CorA